MNVSPVEIPMKTDAAMPAIIGAQNEDEVSDRCSPIIRKAMKVMVAPHPAAATVESVACGANKEGIANEAYSVISHKENRNLSVCMAESRVLRKSKRRCYSIDLNYFYHLISTLSIIWFARFWF